MSSSASLTLYGSNISYFTGKLENYLRVRGIPYTFESMEFPAMKHRLLENVGVMQMPAIKLADGRWLTDTTKIIDWYEGQLGGHPLLPDDPVQAFVCHLLEDWADEWWWRPAMHYRWHYPEGARFASWHLASELMTSVRLPVWLKSKYFTVRQRRGYTLGDGLTNENIPAVEAGVHRLFQQLQHIFSQRPFLFGSRPSLADIGLSGPFFRHFALDPVPLERLRQQAPAVLEWVARLWNTGPEGMTGAWPSRLPEDIKPLLDDIGRAYLPYLCANAEAVRVGRKRFNAEVDGICYRRARYSRYRVWCLGELRSRFLALSDTGQQATRALLQERSCWEPLWRTRDLPLLTRQEAMLPFRGDTKMVGTN